MISKWMTGSTVNKILFLDGHVLKMPQLISKSQHSERSSFTELKVGTLIRMQIF